VVSDTHWEANVCYTLRYMPISIEGSIEVAANQQRRSLPPLPSASPHQNPRLLPRLASCVASITHYPFYLHLDFERANVNNNKRAALQQRVVCYYATLQSFPHVRSLPLPYTCYTYYHRGNGPVCILCSLRRTIVQTMRLRCSAYYAYHTHKPSPP
jgi:hypothetical protein